MHTRKNSDATKKKQKNKIQGRYDVVRIQMVFCGQNKPVAIKMLFLLQIIARDRLLLPIRRLVFGPRSIIRKNVHSLILPDFPN